MTNNTNLSIRAIERFENFETAFKSLSEIENFKTFSNIEKTVFVKRFEFVYELAWKTLKDIFEFEGVENQLKGSLDTIKQALIVNFISDFDLWIKMKNDRNMLSHEYGEDKMDEVLERLNNQYYSELNRLYIFIKDKYSL